MNEHLRLVRPLGEGGMGTVWVAEHLNLGTQVAVKFIHDRFGRDNEEVMQRFHVEARAAAQLRSPHVVQIIDYGVTGRGTPYLAMELLVGESLADRLERKGWLSLSGAVEVVRQCARALDYAHQEGVLHRDIKPDNIFLVEAGDGPPFVKLLDFGVAARLDDDEARKLTTPGLMVGTPEYLAPETLVGRPQRDPQVDLWALAVVAYECLVGDVPFPGETTASVCLSIVKASHEPPSALRKGLCPEVDAFFERAFARDPKARFASGAALAKALADATGEVASASRTKPSLTIAPLDETDLGSPSFAPSEERGPLVAQAPPSTDVEIEVDLEAAPASDRSSPSPSVAGLATVEPLPLKPTRGIHGLAVTVVVALMLVAWGWSRRTERLQLQAAFAPTGLVVPSSPASVPPERPEPPESTDPTDAPEPEPSAAMTPRPKVSTPPQPTPATPFEGRKDYGF